MMKIPYRDLSVKDSVLKQELLQAVDRVLSHGRLILGPEVEMFEQQIADFCRRKYAVGVNSGTDALFLALKGLGIGPGDEVITTPMSWIATLNAIILCGADPVFVDIAGDLNLDPQLLEAAITPRTRAIIPVHFTGKCCRMNEILEIAEKYHILVVEDAAQAFGARIEDRPAGSFGEIGCFSMNPMKVLPAYGEAGMVVTDNQELYEKIRTLRYAGTVNKEDCHFPSLNYKIDTLQAAMLSVNLKYFKKKVERRRQISILYHKILSDVVGCPADDDTYHVYYSYTVIAEDRNALKDYLSEKGIETKIQHPILMPYHTAYRHLPPCRIPVAQKLIEKILCLPNQETLTNEEVVYVAETVKAFYKESNLE